MEGVARAMSRGERGEKVTDEAGGESDLVREQQDDISEEELA